MEYTIVRATNADCSHVQDLVRTCLNEYGAPFDLTSWDKDLVDIEEGYAGGALFMAVTSSDDLMGSVGIAPMGGGAMVLKKMYIYPAFRGVGLGGALLRCALEEARRVGARKVFLQTMEGMHAAQALYEKHGFVQVASVDGPRVQREYELVMESNE